MNDNENDTKVFMNRVQDLINAIHMHGQELDDSRIMEKVLRTPHRKIDPITISIEDSRDQTFISAH